MSYDPKVWTSESPSLSGYYHYVSEMLNGWRIGSFAANDPMRKGHSELRSILPIPSAAEIAALVECELLLRTATPPGDDWWCPTCCDALDGSRVTFEERCDTCGTELTEFNAKPWGEAARAALARLDAARKEQGK